jgi:hypothetical protein
MKFIPYTDEFGDTQYFDPSRVVFTLTQKLPPKEEYKVGEDVPPESEWPKHTKVALDYPTPMWIVCDEAPESLIKRVKEANGITD